MERLGEIDLSAKATCPLCFVEISRLQSWTKWIWRARIHRDKFAMFCLEQMRKNGKGRKSFLFKRGHKHGKVFRERKNSHKDFKK